MHTGAEHITSAADTIRAETPRTEYSLGRIIPVNSRAREEQLKQIAARSTTATEIAATNRVGGEPRPKAAVNTDMGFILLSLSLLIVSLITLFGRKSVGRGLLSISFRRHEAITPAGTSELFAWPLILRNLFTVINVGLFATILTLSPEPAGRELLTDSVTLTAIMTGAFLAALLLRHLTCIIMAEIAGRQNMFREYMNVVYNIWFAIALFLFIINGIILFAPLDNAGPLVTTGLVIGSIFLFIRALRLLWIFREGHISLFYYFLYLCALEVLPVMVILKISGIV